MMPPTTRPKRTRNTLTNNGRRTCRIALIARDRRDTKSYHALWNSVSRFVQGWIGNRRNRGVSDDVCDEVFSEAYPSMLATLRRWEPGRASFNTVYGYELWACENRVRHSHLPMHVPRHIYDDPKVRVGFDRSSVSLDAIPTRADDPGGHAEVDEAVSELLDCMARLRARDRRVIELMYGLDGGPPRKLREIGAEFRISKERARQLGNAAHERLRKIAAGREWEGVAS